MELKTITLNFSGKEFKINGIGDMFDLNGLRLQVVDFITEKDELQKWSSEFKNTQDMTRWTRTLSDKAKTFYGLEMVRGRAAKTIANERGVYAYSAWLNEEFGFTVIRAFEAAAHGDGEKAVSIAKTVVSEYRQDSIEHTQKLAGIVNKYFGKYLTREMLRTIHNHANRKMFGMETEQLREKAREITGSKAKKIAHRDLYEDFTTLRITSMMSSLSLRIKKMEGQALSPDEVVQGIILAIDEIADVQGGAEAPEYLPEERIKKVNQKKVSK